MASITTVNSGRQSYKGFFYNGEFMANVDDFDIFQYQLTHYKKIYVNNFFFTPDKA